MSDVKNCPTCGTQLPPDAANAPCPACLMQLGLKSWENRQSVPPTFDSPAGSPSNSAFVPPKPGDLSNQFPQYEMLDLVGHGGMGAVYKARQKSLDRLVAIKLINPDAAGDSGFAERFLREARALARLNHPNIVGVHDFGECDGLFFFVMEYVEGVNLRRLIETKELAPEQALEIVPQICEALQYAHDEGIVHRDIKPENILIDSKGRAKIADFGLAKLVSTDQTDQSLTATHQVMGTPRYMAPEQMEGARHVDHRADIFSLGVVFYEMLTGELPLGRFDPPSSRASVNSNLDQVVMRSLEKEPDRRYQHASEIKNEVERISSPDLPPVRPMPIPPIAKPTKSADVPTIPNTGMIIMGLIMALMGMGMLIMSATGHASSPFLWVGLGITLGGGGCVSSAFADGTRLPADARPNFGLILQGTIMMSIGVALITVAVWQSDGRTLLYAGNPLSWVGIGLNLGGGGCLASAWQKDKEAKKKGS